MTVSSDARTPSASVHALSGSTPPGSAPVVQPFGVATAAAGVAEMPETFAPLGQIAMGIAGQLRPDAAVINLAGRVEALADRHARVYHRMLVIHGRVDKWRFANRPKRPDTMPSGLTLVRSRTDTHEVTHIEQPLSLLSEQKAQREAYEAAAAAHEEAVERKRARTREPYLDKLQARMWWRLECWVRALADAEPQTQAGLAAKAAASVAVTRAADDLDWARDLAVSVSEDALRIICAEAEARAEQDRQADPFATFHAEIVDLQATITATKEGSPESEEAWKRWGEVDDRALGSRPTTLAGAIGALEYARREHHQFTVENRADMGLDVDRTDELVLHLIDGALDVLRPMAGMALPQSNIRPVPLAPLEFPAGRYPAGTSREVIETYRTFLDMELRYLNHEVYGRTEGRMHLWLDNPAGALHGPREPAASTRAAAVLSLLGLMPTEGVHGKAQADGLAHAAASAA